MTLPPGQSMVEPFDEIVGVVGEGLVITTISAEVTEQAPEVIVTE